MAFTSWPGPFFLRGLVGLGGLAPAWWLVALDVGRSGGRAAADWCRWRVEWRVWFVACAAGAGRLYLRPPEWAEPCAARARCGLLDLVGAT